MKTNLSRDTQDRTRLLLYFGALLSLFAFSEVSLAEDAKTLGDLATSVTGSMSALASLIGAGAYVAGLGFTLAGLVKFKAHRDNPQQVPLSAPMVLLAVAAGLVFLPSVITSTGQTIFGGDQTSGGVSGAGLSALGGS